MKIPFTIVCALLSLTGTLIFSSCCTPVPQFPNEDSSDRLQIIDTHIHLYDTNRSQGVDWPPVMDKVLYRPVLTEHFDELADRYRQREGGYTRVLKIGNRAGDAAPLSLVELVDRAPTQPSEG